MTASTPVAAEEKLPLTIAAEIAVTLMGLAVALSFARVYEDSTYRRPLILTVVLAHGLAVLARRLGISLWISALMSAAGMLISQGLIHYGSSTQFGLPTSTTRTQIQTDLTDAWTAFGSISAPVAVLPGFVLASAVALWLVMFLADWAAFRMRSGFEAILPPAVIFIFLSLFSAEQYQLRSVTMFAAAVLFFIVMHRAAAMQELNTSWLGGTSQRGTQAVVAAGGVIAVTSLLFGVVAGPRLPGADDAPIVDLEKVGDGPGTRVALNPLVDIQAQLIDLPNTVVFTVKTDEPTYWKLTSLPVFDGKQFTANESFEKVEGDLESIEPRDISYELEQEFTINGLAGEWLPAAQEPVRAEPLAGDFEISWNSNISSLITRDRSTTVETGMQYSVTSGIVTPDLAAIKNATIPSDVDDVYLELPDDFSPRAIETARQVTATATSPYEQALQLQKYFLTFDYDIDVARGHSINRIDDFLDARVGYCEQFATAFATMARSLGLPTRVSIGFTEGEFSADEQLYRVRGAQAHAWPEVLFEGLGWLRFEPTPGRGAPGDEVYTGQGTDATVEPDVSATPTVPPTTVAQSPGTATGQGSTTTLPNQQAAPALGETAEGFSVPLPLILGVLGVLAAIGLTIGSILGLKSRKRQRVLAEHATENRRVIAEAWLTAQDDLAMAGITPVPAETPIEYAHRAGSQLSTIRPNIERLASLVTTARFRQSDPSNDDVVAAKEAAGAIGQHLDNSLSWVDRSKFALDPRPLLPEKSSVRTR